MSRIGAGEVRHVPPTNNIYTALAGIAVLIQLIGLAALFMKASTVGGLF